VRTSLSSVSGGSTVHLRNFTVRNDPALGLGSTLDLEQDSHGVQPDTSRTAAVGFEVHNAALLGGARVDLALSSAMIEAERPARVLLSNVVCERGLLSMHLSGEGKEAVGVKVRNSHFGGAGQLAANLANPGRIKLTGCTFEPFDVPAGSERARDVDPSYALPWSALGVAFGVDGVGFAHRVELSGCVFLLSARARSAGRDGWWSAIGLRTSRATRSRLVLRGCVIAPEYDFGIQNPARRVNADPDSSADGLYGGGVSARHLRSRPESYGRR